MIHHQLPTCKQYLLCLLKAMTIYPYQELNRSLMTQLLHCGLQLKIHYHIRTTVGGVQHFR